MIHIDGAFGEGGGQVLRTALGLSVATGQPFTIDGIRRHRQKPGLQRQHLTAVLAAQQVGDADVDGAETGSTSLSVRPRGLRAGALHFAIGTAGSTTLVCRRCCPALWSAGAASTVETRRRHTQTRSHHRSTSWPAVSRRWWRGSGPGSNWRCIGTVSIRREVAC